MSTKAKKGRVLSIDMSDAEGFAVLPEGPATLTVEEITEEEGQESGQPYLKWTLAADSDEGPKGKVWENTSLQPQALFKLRGMLEAFGFEIPDKAMDVDLDELIGCQCRGDIVHEEYKGKNKAKVDTYYPIEETPPEPAPKAVAKAAPAKAAPAGPKKAAPKAAEPEVTLDIGDKVSFLDDTQEEQVGKVTDVNGDAQTASVKVGKEIWEVDFRDLTVL